MQCQVTNTLYKDYDGDALILGIFEEDLQYNKFLEGKLKALFDKKVFEGKPDTAYTMDTLQVLNAEHIILVGLGKKEEASYEVVRKAAANAARQAVQIKAGTVAAEMKSFTFNHQSKELAQAFTEGFILAQYQYEEHRSQKTAHLVKKLLLLSSKDAATMQEGTRRASILAEHAMRVRDLSNMPSNFLTPEGLAKQAKKIAKDARLKIKVYNKRQIEKLGFTALLAVNSGARKEPRFIVMEYAPSRAKKTVLLVGKGVTFDAGGVQVKPGKGMGKMKYDMTGAALMMNTIAAAAKLKVPHKIVAIMPATENMNGENCYKPGDVLHMLNGKTVEINHTDAEGRLILADGLAYGTKKYKPDYIIDAATLTGATTVALGQACACLVSTDEHLAKTLEQAGEETMERVWRMPLWQYHKDLLKSPVADLSNIGMGPRGGEAGALTAAAFLWNFTNDIPWAHLDIAGMAWSYADEHYFTSGGSGWGVRLLVHALESL